jgi:hypothetical protein
MKGANGTTGSKGDTGNQGETGYTGQKGDTGANGTSVSIIGTVPAVGEDPQATLNTAFVNAVSGNGVVDEEAGDLWVYGGSVWVNAGKIKGDTGANGSQGATGATGASALWNFRGEFNPSNALYTVGDVVTSLGQTYYCILYTGVYEGPSDTSKWTLIASSGSKGDTGTQGVTGATGAQGATGSDASIPGMVISVQSGISAMSITTNGRLSYSTDDGVTWTLGGETPFIGGAIPTIASNGSFWLAGYSNTNGVSMIKTSDGINYTTVTNPLYTCSQIAWNGVYWLAVGILSDSTPVVAKSTDAVTWSSTTVTGLNTNPSYELAWNGSMWLAAGADGSIGLSSDGSTWTIHTTFPSNAIRWLGTSESFWIAGYTGAWISADGINWTATNAPFPGGVTAYITYNGSMWLAGGYRAGFIPYDEQIATSSDGINWTVVNTGLGEPFAPPIRAVSWTGSLWIVTFATGKYATSPNGVNWTGGSSTNAPLEQLAFLPAILGSRVYIPSISLDTLYLNSNRLTVQSSVLTLNGQAITMPSVQLAVANTATSGYSLAGLKKGDTIIITATGATTNHGFSLGYLSMSNAGFYVILRNGSTDGSNIVIHAGGSVVSSVTGTGTLYAYVSASNTNQSSCILYWNGSSFYLY